ncbi:MAG: hypothetical protein R6W96_08965 [Clostridia bacterium]
MDIGSRMELFVDDFLIRKMENLSLVLHPPERKEKVLVFDKPWENPTSGYATFIRDEKEIKMYYRGKSPGNDPDIETTCLAVSKDGIHFSRPSLGLVEFQGSRDNNILLQGKAFCHNFTPFLDTNPHCRAEERYKAVGGHERTGINTGLLYGFVSPDGVHWHKIQEGPVMTRGMFDSQNNAFFDTNTGRYVCYFRYFHNLHLENPGEYEGIRAIRCAFSDDFREWSLPEDLVYKPDVMEEFYTNAILPCPEAPHLYLGFPKRFVPGRTRDSFTQDGTGVSDAMFITARHPFRWDKTFLQAWVRPGLDQKNWVNRNNMPCLGILDTGYHEFSMYISEHYRMPSSGIRRLSLRKHGFASVHAGAGEGLLLTKSFLFRGDFLHVNASTSATGFIRVRILDANGHVLGQSDDWFGDALSERLSFGKSLKPYEKAGIQLEISMRDADLYAIKFMEGA